MGATGQPEAGRAQLAKRPPIGDLTAATSGWRSDRLRDRCRCGGDSIPQLINLLGQLADRGCDLIRLLVAGAHGVLRSVVAPIMRTRGAGMQAKRFGQRLSSERAAAGGPSTQRASMALLALASPPFDRSLQGQQIAYAQTSSVVATGSGTSSPRVTSGGLSPGRASTSAMPSSTLSRSSSRVSPVARRGASVGG
jgi:hypothetical protein